MRIGIVGAGNIGSVLAARLTELGHEVRVANSRGPETLAELEASSGATAVVAAEAATGADLVVVTVPEKAVAELDPAVLGGRSPHAVVVDTGNYYPERDGRIDTIEDGTAESRWVTLKLGVDVVKAFNNIQSTQLRDAARPAGEARRVALPVAGDDADGKDVVMRLVEELGFDAVDAGGLDESWRQQPGQPAYGTDLGAEDLREALAQATPERAPEWRA